MFQHGPQKDKESVVTCKDKHVKGKGYKQLDVPVTAVAHIIQKIKVHRTVVKDWWQIEETDNTNGNQRGELHSKQDNDPKHVAKNTQEWLKKKNTGLFRSGLLWVLI